MVIRAEAALASSLRGGSLASERAVDRSEYGEYSASLSEKSFEIPIRSAEVARSSST